MDVHACVIAVVERIQFVFPMQVVPVLMNLKASDIIFCYLNFFTSINQKNCF